MCNGCSGVYGWANNAVVLSTISRVLNTFVLFISALSSLYAAMLLNLYYFKKTFLPLHSSSTPMQMTHCVS